MTSQVQHLLAMLQKTVAAKPFQAELTGCAGINALGKRPNAMKLLLFNIGGAPQLCIV